MKPNSLLLLAALLAAAPAFAAGTLPEKANAKAAAHAALADGTDDVSNKPTTFPTQAQASAQARAVLPLRNTRPGCTPRGCPSSWTTWPLTIR